MICGINFGYSKEDEQNEALGIYQGVEAPSFFSDETVNKTKFRNRLLKWLGSWGVELTSQPGSERAIEKAYFQTNWIDSQTRDVQSEAVINTETLVMHANGLLSLVECRKPQIIVFVGACLVQAFNASRLRKRVESVLGARSGNAQIVGISTNDYKGRRFKVFSQTFGQTDILCLPHTQTRGLSDEYIASLSIPQEVQRKLRRNNMA